MNEQPVDSGAARHGRRREQRSAGKRVGDGARRLRRAWRALHGDQRLAAVAALGLFATMFLPWYSTTVKQVVAGKLQTAKDGHTAIATFGWIEISILLVAASVLLMLFARAERRAFHLPGGDGSVIMAAGLWVCLLFVWRIFDRPDFGRGVPTELSWGIFVAVPAAILLAYAGSRIRAAAEPEPPLVSHEEQIVVSDERPWLDETEQVPAATERAAARRSSSEDRPRQHPAEVPEPADPPAPPDSLR